DKIGGLVRAIRSEGEGSFAASYDVKQTESSVVLGAAEIEKPSYIKFVGKNLATEKDVIIEFWHASITAESAAQLLSEDCDVEHFSSDLITPSGKSSRYEQRALG